MDHRRLTETLSVAGQIHVDDLAAIAQAGFRTLICNRPDGEGSDQPTFPEIERAARDHGLEAIYLPVTSGKVTDEDAQAFKAALDRVPGPVFAYCRSGTRSTTLWALSQASQRSAAEILETARAAGYDMSGVVRRIVNGGRTPTDRADVHHDVVVVGGGAAGIAVTASMLQRDPDLDVAIIDPADVHYYQPGWTLVGGGVFDARTTVRTMAELIPRGAHWIKAAVAAFEPDANAIVLDGCRIVTYKYLVVCPGLKVNWRGIEGLEETLGENGVTSNYRYDLAPYTWHLVQSLKKGRALFTQPPMPIKCAGAPQKALYLSADHWRRTGVLDQIEIEFHNAGAVLFGVKEYVPALMEYIERYKAKLCFNETLVAVDGPARKAWFDCKTEAGDTVRREQTFDMIHVVPPQTAPDFVRASPLVDAAGWVDVDQTTLRHKKFANIYSLGDVMNAPNAKTAAAARKQAPTVAQNLLADLGRKVSRGGYDGYGSCPLTVERGKIILAEFGYGGRLLPSFPKALLDGTRPSRLAWLLKEKILPPVYWKAMLRGHEWMAKPEPIPAATPTPPAS